MRSSRLRALLVTLLIPAAPVATVADSDIPPLPIEETGIVETLPADWPASWFLVHDAAFFHMNDGKVYVIDALADSLSEQVKGLFNVVFIGNVAQSARRNEIYATETFYTRGHRGDRTDTVTITDTENLAPIAEVILPGNKRFNGMPQRFMLVPIHNDDLLLVSNFNPATSVTIIDLDKREIINEVATPACTLTYPTGKRGFSSLCSDGRLMSVQLDEAGQVTQKKRTDPFFSSEDSPIFERPAIVDGIAYFPAFDGQVHTVDLRGDVANVTGKWNLVPDAEQAEGWRPGGVALIDRDDLGHFYLLMHPEGGEGTQGSGGAEVWVFDGAKQQRVRRIPLQEWGLSLAVSRGNEPLLMVTNPVDMSVEVYDAVSGKFIRKITDFGQETPLMLHGSRLN